MGVRKKRDPGKEAFWREVVQRQRAGGLSVRGFCRGERLKETAFYYWRRELERRDRQRRAAGERTGRPRREGAAREDGGERSSGKATLATFLPVQLAPAPQTTGIELALPSGAVLRMPPGTGVEEAARLVVAVEGRLC